MPNGRVVGLLIPGGGSMPRSEIDAYDQFVPHLRRKGLAYIRSTTKQQAVTALQAPIVKNLHDAALAQILERTGAKDGDLIFFGADKAKIVNDAIGALRVKVGQRIRQSQWLVRRCLETIVGDRL